MILLAAESTQRAIALVVLVVALLLWLGYLVLENRRTTTDIVDSFLDAPNRKLAPNDDVFEGPRLDRFLGWALVSMVVVALSLPLYWLGEPGRHEGSIRGFDKRSVNRGEELFGIGKEHPGFNCARCHGAGGGGGVASFTVAKYNDDGSPQTDPKTGKPVLEQVSWTAPRINNVALRYQPDQIRNVLIYGRGGAKNNPMPAWGVKGGGPGNEQQIDDLVNYLKHLSVEKNPAAEGAYNNAWSTNGHDASKAYAAAVLAAAKVAQSESTKLLDDNKSAAAGVVKNADSSLAAAEKVIVEAKAALVEAKKGTDVLATEKAELAVTAAQIALTAQQATVAGARKVVASGDGEILFNLNCARCHTNGYSYGQPKEQASGYYGPSLRKSSLTKQFPDPADQEAFIAQGVSDQQAYGTGGVNHWSGGGMAYFGNVLTADQIKEVVAYERGLVTPVAGTATTIPATAGSDSTTVAADPTTQSSTTLANS